MHLVAGGARQGLTRAALKHVELVVITSHGQQLAVVTEARRPPRTDSKRCALGGDHGSTAQRAAVRASTSLAVPRRERRGCTVTKYRGAGDVPARDEEARAVFVKF